MKQQLRSLATLLILNSFLSVSVFPNNHLKPVKSSPQQQYKGSINLIINSLPPKKGVLYIAIHTKESFLKETPPPYRILQVKDFKALPLTVPIKNVKPGDYAITSFYDQNDNQKLDFFFFIPSEPTAFSEDYRPIAMPQFKECSFKVTQNVVTQSLNL